MASPGGGRGCQATSTSQQCSNHSMCFHAGLARHGLHEGPGLELPALLQARWLMAALLETLGCIQQSGVQLHHVPYPVLFPAASFLAAPLGRPPPPMTTCGSWRAPATSQSSSTAEVGGLLAALFQLVMPSARLPLLQRCHPHHAPCHPQARSWAAATSQAACCSRRRHPPSPRPPSATAPCCWSPGQTAARRSARTETPQVRG